MTSSRTSYVSLTYHSPYELIEIQITTKGTSQTHNTITLLNLLHSKLSKQVQGYLACCTETKLFVWDFLSQTLLHTLLFASITTIEFTDMNHIAVAGKAIRIIEIEQNTNTLPIILAHPISKSSVKQMVALDLNTLVCANDKNLFVWNIASKTLTSNISAPGIVRLHQIDNDQFVVVVKNVVVVYNRRLTVLHTYSMREQIITSISSKILYFMGAVSGTCRLILNTGDQQTISKYNGLDLCVINKYIITAVFGGLCVSNMDAVSLYTIPDHSSGASHIDDKLLYVDKEYNVVLYDLELRAPIRMYKGVSEPVSKLAAIKRDERKLYNKEKNKTLHVPL